MELRPYQERLVVGLATKIAEGKRTVVGQLATGGGKTVVFSAICNRFIKKWPTQSVLILVHRKELLQQTRRTLWNAFKIIAQPIVAGMRNIPHAQVYVGMVESAHRRSSQLTNVGLIIIDEAHIANFTKIHESYPDKNIIGFTATPLSANKKKPMKMYYQDIVCGVDIPDLIAQGSLCQNLTVAPKDTVQRASLTIKAGEFDEGLMAMKFSAKQYVNNTVEAYKRYAIGTKTIVFNVTVDHSLLVCNAFKEAGYDCRHFDGTSTAQERSDTLKWFAETPDAILCNVGIATTGFDEPTIETVIVNKATMSMPLWLQMVGRGSRPSDAKAMFRVIDMGGNAITHGDWCQPRDWEDIFFNPPKAGDGGGVAAVKSCPQCDAIIAAQCRTCPQCGYEYPSKEVEMEEKLGEFVLVTKGINPAELIMAHKEKKEYYPFFEIGRTLAIQAKNTVAKMTDENAEYIFSKYETLAQEWCALKGKKFNKWHKDQAKAHLYNELSLRFPKWQNPVAAPAPPPVKSKSEVKPFDTLPSLTHLSTLSL